MIASASSARGLAAGSAPSRAADGETAAASHLLDRGVAFICLDRLLDDAGPDGESAFHATCDWLDGASDFAALVLQGTTAWRAGDEAGRERASIRLAHLASILSTLPYPIIASISGDMSAIGLRLACACHFVIAEEGTGFSAASEPFAVAGPIAGWNTERYKAATNLIAAGSLPKTAADAFAARLVDWIVPTGRGACTAGALAKTLANGPGELLTIAQRQSELRRTALAA